MKPDELNWKRVDDGDLADVDNDEGWFYGLEEIDDDVTVEKDGTGKVSFVPRRKRASPDESAAGSAAEPLIKQATKRASTDESAAEPLVKQAKKSAKSNAKSSAPKSLSSSSSDRQPESGTKIAETGKAVEVDNLGSWPALHPQLLGSLKKLGFMEPTAVQVQSIPPALEGKDVIGKAATGSGKTLAFGLPILHRFLKNGKESTNSDIEVRPPRPLGLVIAPTRELAHQIRDHLTAVLYRSAIAVTGGLSIQKQLRLLSKNPPIVVATPGRLLEVVEQMPAAQRREWQQIGTLVLDEADRLVQTGSYKDLDSLLDVLGRGKRQTLVFSATLDAELGASLSSNRKRRRDDLIPLLQEKFGLRKTFAFIDADPATKVATQVAQAVIECPTMEKDLYLYYLLTQYPGRTLVFVNSIDAVKRVAPLLREVGLAAHGVHSDMIQKQRLRAVERFKNTPQSVLVATDVAARGLDVPLVDHVVHYHLPRTGDMYVHRSGRTGRAGHAGVAISLCSPQEASGPLPRLAKLLKTRLSPLSVDFAVLEQLRHRVRLAKEIADAVQSKTIKGKTASWEAAAAAELGVDLDDVSGVLGDKRGPGKGKMGKSKEAADVARLRAELESLLRAPLGPRRKYLTGGTQNLAHLLLSDPEIGSGRARETALEAVSRKIKST